MPSQRKRIGFLPSEEVHEIIDKLCRANEISQSKITGLLVEEALRSRGVLRDSNSLESSDVNNFSYDSVENRSFNNKKSTNNNNHYKLNKKSLSEDIKMMHEFIEFKFFKKVMSQNNIIVD